MALPRVEVSIGITLNVGNYESVRAEARFGMDQSSGSTATAFSSCLAEAEKGLEAALDGVEKMLAARKPKPVIQPPMRHAGVPAPAGPRRAGR